MSVKSKYPKEVFSALTSNSTMSVTGKFFEADGRSGDADKKPVPPYKIYQQTFSLFKFSILAKNREGRYVPATANIKVDEVADIVEMTRCARQLDTCVSVPVIKEALAAARRAEKKIDDASKLMNRSFKAVARLIQTGSMPAQSSGRAEAEKTDPNVDANRKKAGEARFRMGNYKDMSPLDVLTGGGASDADAVRKNCEELSRQKEFLSKNLSKYPANQGLISAIDAALSLVGEGYVLKAGVVTEAKADGQPESGGNLGVIVIHAPVSKGDQYKKDPATGLYPASEISIRWVLGAKYPVEITIKNYMAPIKFYPDGRQNTLVSQMDETTLVTNTYRLTSAQWSHCLYIMQANMRRFEIIHAASQFDQAEAIEKANIAETKRKAADMSAGQPQPQPQMYAPTQPQPQPQPQYQYQQAPPYPYRTASGFGR